MQYSEWKEILMVSGEVAAIMCLDELEGKYFYNIAISHPEIAHRVKPSKMGVHGVGVLLDRDINWLQNIDTTQITNLVCFALLHRYNGYIPHLDIASRSLIELHNIVACFPKQFPKYQELAFARFNIFFWDYTCRANSELKQHYDPKPLIEAIRYLQNFKYIETTSLKDSAHYFSNAPVSTLLSKPDDILAFLTDVEHLKSSQLTGQECV